MTQPISSRRIHCCSGYRKKLDARVPQNEIAGIYDSLSSIYDLWGNLTESRARNRALELAEIKNGQKVLEVAVGTGLAFYEIVKQNPDGTNIGIDISAGMLKKAQKRLNQLSGANYELKQASAFQLEAEEEQFDVLINNYMFDLIPFQYDRRRKIRQRYLRFNLSGITPVNGGLPRNQAVRKTKRARL
jgi:ubiquinone/menaquinone biosynthesis C-methylase UbiE